MPIYADPVDGLAVPVTLLQTWTARLVETLGTPADIDWVHAEQLRELGDRLAVPFPPAASP